MFAARLSRTLPRLAQAARARPLSGPTITEQLQTVKDVKVKDIPQWASSVNKDPKTEAAVKARAPNRSSCCCTTACFMNLRSADLFTHCSYPGIMSCVTCSLMGMRAQGFINNYHEEYIKVS